MDGKALSPACKESLMREALLEAERGMENGEVPIGCVIAVREKDDCRIVARGYNSSNALRRKTAHAEIIAFERTGAPAPGQSPALPLDADHVILVSTLEPCVMCLGAAIEAGIHTVLFGLPAPADSGAPRIQPPESPESNYPQIEGEIFAAESRALFETWLDAHRHEPENEQVKYVTQLLSLV